MWKLEFVTFASYCLAILAIVTSLLMTRPYRMGVLMSLGLLGLLITSVIPVIGLLCGSFSTLCIAAFIALEFHSAHKERNSVKL